MWSKETSNRHTEDVCNHFKHKGLVRSRNGQQIHLVDHTFFPEMTREHWFLSMERRFYHLWVMVS